MQNHYTYFMDTNLTILHIHQAYCAKKKEFTLTLVLLTQECFFFNIQSLNDDMNKC